MNQVCIVIIDSLTPLLNELLSSQTFHPFFYAGDYEEPDRPFHFSDFYEVNKIADLLIVRKYTRERDSREAAWLTEV